MQKISYLLSFIMVTMILQGCVASNSSGSVSESTSSLSKSSGSGSDSAGSFANSSTSSSGAGDEAGDKSLELQVMDYTFVYLSTVEFDKSAFTKGISEIAASNGISDWEDEEEIWVGIGRALKKANIEGTVFKTYQKSLADSKPVRMNGIQLGYNMQ